MSNDIGKKGIKHY